MGISGSQDGAITNATVALISLCFGCRKAAWNGPAILFGVLGSITLLFSLLFLSNNEASVVKSDVDKRLLADTAFLVRGLGHELFVVGMLAWCSVVNGHS